ncbi:MAG: extracellular solute-binding protein [Chloroflexi bacterium]|nr:extracellular solute-binding protein [Chloroflexota bacterium]
MKKLSIYLLMMLAAMLLLVACGGAEEVAETDTLVEADTSASADAPAESDAEMAHEAGEADLAAVKAYAVDHAHQMKAGTEAFRAGAETYHALITHVQNEHPDENPYEHLWNDHPDEMRELVEQMREDWFTASQHYELIEGIVAGVPTLAYFDGWIDAGPPGADDPEEAIAWQLVLADGTVLESPGNFFHDLTEPALYGTIDEYVGLAVDIDGDGNVELGEVLPEAEILLASAQGLDMATAQMVEAVEAWEPTLEDAFMALVTMIPTMNEYFEQWKLSSYIAGNDFEEAAFIAVSRLFDINGILTGLDVTYDKVRPVVGGVDADLDTQIDTGFDDLVGYVGDLYAQEQEGVTFAPEEADAFGTEAQDKATALAALVAQAAAKANIDLAAEMEGWEPDSPPVMKAVAPEPAGFAGSEEAMEESMDDPGVLVIYSGRKDSLVQPIIDQFAEATGIEVEVRYGKTAEMAGVLLEEGANSPADVFYAQDPGGLGAIQDAGMLATLPDSILSQVPARFASDSGEWVGVSGRARVIAYNTDAITDPATELPQDMWGFTEPEWNGRIGWPPTNGSFQAMVTAMRAVWGEEKTTEWLLGIQANNPIVYPKNTPTVAAVAAGEVDVGFVNHYYLYRFISEEGEGFQARNYFLPGGGPGSLIMVSGAGILNTAPNAENAQKFIEFLLTPEAQAYFSGETFEYPVVEGVETIVETPLSELDAQAIGIPLADLADLAGTQDLLIELGIIE